MYMKDFLKETILEAGELAKDYFEKGVSFEVKSHLADLLTEADIKTSEFLVNAIHKEYPDHGITSEELEESINPGAEYELVIDPIDGTRNFAVGIPMWGIIIAFVQNGETILGAVYNPVGNQLFFAEYGHGATVNGMPIKIGEKNDFDMAIGNFSRMPNKGEVYGSHIEEYKHFLDRMNRDTNIWIHQFGTMLSMCHMAAGGIDLCVQNAGLDHDYLAPALIVREAGGIVTDSDGNEWQRGRQDIVASNKLLHPQIMKLFS